MGCGKIKSDDFPPIEVVRIGDKFYSLSNRRLFVFRVLACHGIVSEVLALVYCLASSRVLRERWCDSLDRMASKFERSWSSRCDGAYVEVRSCFVNYQCQLREGWVRQRCQQFL